MSTLSSSIRLLLWLPLVSTSACVDPEDILLRGTNDILVIDGTITNLAETQLITINRSTADRLTGRFGTLPITKAQVEVVIDSSVVTTAHETTDGLYQLPADFKGQVGHAYQLRFTLRDGTHYESTQQVMPPQSPLIRSTLSSTSKVCPPGAGLLYLGP
ncbi:DUF4249 family protein [Spirosoma telluris]|uniref:DUF4249 family protein n=1 Tax=Spirosoma telluris TaxID=2183553 RepID=UPI002FC3A82A